MRLRHGPLQAIVERFDLGMMLLLILLSPLALGDIDADAHSVPAVRADLLDLDVFRQPPDIPPRIPDPELLPVAAPCAGLLVAPCHPCPVLRQARLGKRSPI